MSYEPQDRFKERLSPEVIFFDQLKRCLEQQSMDPESPQFQGAVNGLLCSVPKKVRDRVHGRRKEYEEDVYRFEYDYFCDQPLGTITAPLTQINEQTGDSYPIPYITVGKGKEKTQEINWDSPHIMSPHRIRDTVTDWEEILRILMEEAESAGLSWQVDEIEQDAGDTEEEVKRKKTPFRKPRTPDGEVITGETEDEEEDDEENDEG